MHKYKHCLNFHIHSVAVHSYVLFPYGAAATTYIVVWDLLLLSWSYHFSGAMWCNVCYSSSSDSDLLWLILLILQWTIIVCRHFGTLIFSACYNWFLFLSLDYWCRYWSLIFFSTWNETRVSQKYGCTWFQFRVLRK